MAKLQKEFEEFDKAIKIDREAPALRDKRDKLEGDIKEKFPEKCKEYGIDIKASDLRFINQGSYKIGTTISMEGKSVDLDCAVIFPLDIGEHEDSRKIKKAVKSALFIEKKRVPKIKEPCVTVSYFEDDEEYMHIDFPLYAEHKSKKYLARGKEFSEDYKWEEADPEGLNEYLLNKLSINGQIKRVVRYVKKWKAEKYKNASTDHEIPASVGLTLLVCSNYVDCTTDGDDDLSSLYYTMKAIRDDFEIIKDNDEVVSASIKCELPVVPYSDVFYKMRDSSEHMLKFYKRIDSAVSNLQDAVSLSEEHEAAKKVQRVLGEDFTVPEKKAKAVDTVTKGEYSYG